MSSCKAVLVLLAFLSFGLAAPARASQITLTDWTDGDFATNASNGGGPFKATTDSLGVFVTFCLEFNEHFSYDTPYSFSLSDGAVSGGVGGQLPGSNFDPVSDATKWIYTEVRTDGYKLFQDYFGWGAGVGARVQEAIWYLENERTIAEIAPESLSLANFALGQNWGLLADAGHSVQAMNMGLAQDQLFWSYDPSRKISQNPEVPEPASLMLLGTGLTVAARRFRKNRR